jgi:hypothetical protein
VLSSICVNTCRVLFVSLLTVSIAACGDASREIHAADEHTRDVTSDIANDVGDGANELAKGAKEAGEEGEKNASEGAQTVRNVAVQGSEHVQNKGQHAADTVVAGAHDVADEAREAAHAASDWGSNLERPILEQRKEKCAQESGSWAEVVDVSACKDGYATVTLDGSSVEQTCEGDGPGQQLTGQCVHKTAPVLGTYYFNDGPSTPHYLQRFGEIVSDRTHFLRWNDLFWEAAVNHDYCYHHGQITYGYTQKDCDGQFIDDLLATCRSGRGDVHDWFDSEVCMQNAQGMYGAVRQFGGDNFDAMNTLVHYPKYTSLFDKLNVMRDKDDDMRREYIESWIF